MDPYQLPNNSPPHREAEAQRPADEADRPSAPVSCRRIQAVLFDYLTHELGPPRALLIREHLRHCESCRAAALHMQDTLKWLQASDPADKSPPHLSAQRRRRLARAMLHPLFDRLARHHVGISLAITALLLIVILLLLLARRQAPPPVRIFPVWPHLPG